MKRQHKVSSPEKERLVCHEKADSFSKCVSPVQVASESLETRSSTPVFHNDFDPLSYGIDELDDFEEIDAKLPLDESKSADILPQTERRENPSLKDRNELLNREFYKMYSCFQQLPLVDDFEQFSTCWEVFQKDNRQYLESFDDHVK